MLDTKSYYITHTDILDLNILKYNVSQLRGCVSYLATDTFSDKMFIQDQGIRFRICLYRSIIADSKSPEAKLCINHNATLKASIYLPSLLYISISVYVSGVLGALVSLDSQYNKIKVQKK